MGDFAPNVELDEAPTRARELPPADSWVNRRAIWAFIVGGMLAAIVAPVVTGNVAMAQVVVPPLGMLVVTAATAYTAGSTYEFVQRLKAAR